MKAATLAMSVEGHKATFPAIKASPLYPQKRTSRRSRSKSAGGHKQTSRCFIWSSVPIWQKTLLWSGL